MGAFGVIVQLALGVFLFGVLIRKYNLLIQVKRYTETPRRTWLVWGLVRQTLLTTGHV